MLDYFTQLGKVYLSEHVSDEALMAVGANDPIVEPSSQQKEDTPVKTAEAVTTEENTGRHDSVSVKTPVMPVRTEAHQVQPAGRGRRITSRPFDHLAALILAKQSQENEIGNSSQRIGTTGHAADSRNMWQRQPHHQAGQQAPYTHPHYPAEIAVTVFDAEIRL